VVVPFGAAASPDLTILPVFLAAAAASTAAAVGALIASAAVTIATMLDSRCLPPLAVIRSGAAVLLVIGALVLAGIL